MILIAQFVLCGGIIAARQLHGVAPVSYLVSARWGFAASASTVDLRAVERAVVAPAPSLPTLDTSDHAWTWQAGVAPWTVDIMVLLIEAGAPRGWLVGLWPGRTS